MLDKFIYENHLGQRFDGLENGVYLNTSELRNYTWSYNTINSRISRFYRKTTNRKIPLYVVGKTDAQAIEAMNRLFDITEADVALHVPGKIFVGEYYTTGFVTVSKKTEYLQSKQLCKMEMTLTSDDPAWYRDEVHSFYTDASTPKAAKSGDVITVSNVPASPVRGFTLYGRTTQDGTPTPDAPVELESVGADGNVKVVSAGRNLAALEPRLESNLGMTSSYNASTGVITLKGTATGTAFLSYWLKEPIPAGVPLVFGMGNDVTDGNVSIRAQSETDAKNTTISTLNEKNKITNAALAHSFEFVVIRIASGATVDMTLQIGIMIGKDASDYAYSMPDEPKNATITTPNGLPGVPVTSGGNYTDANGQQWIADSIEYDADEGTAKYVQRVQHVRITSTSHPWSTSSNLTGRYSINNPTPAAMKGVAPMCTAFPGQVNTTSVANCMYINAAGTQLVFNTPYATLDEWKAYLDANEIYLAYAMAEPIETDLTTSEFYALRMQSPNTTLYNEDGAFMDVVYSPVANTSGSAVGGFDYPYEYNLEYGVQIGGRTIANSTYTGNAFRLLIYGAVTNPTIIIGGHSYTVNGAVGEGETLTIDSMAKTITLTTASGAKINYFDKRDRQNYIFQPIQPGQNAVTWSGDFGFELTVIEERSEPKWT